MKRWIIGILITCLAIMLVGSIYIFNRIDDFFEPVGVKVFGEFAHINLVKKCYLIAGVDDDDAKESIITISGLIQPLKENGSPSKFIGYADVAQYPVSFAQAATWTSGVVEEDFLWINGQAMHLMEEDCDRWYSIHVVRSNPDIVVVEIHTADGSILAVTGESMEQAWNNYEVYCDLLYKNKG